MIKNFKKRFIGFIMEYEHFTYLEDAPFVDDVYRRTLAMVDWINKYERDKTSVSTGELVKACENTNRLIDICY